MSKREQVHALIAQGKTTKQIAEELNTTVANVRYHREKSKQKRSQQISEHRRKLKRKAVDYSGGKCLRCAYDVCLAALEFHHLDPSQKDCELNGSSWGWDAMKIEADKTILLCSNCHHELHAGVWAANDTMIEKQNTIREAYVDRPLTEYSDKLHS